MDGIKGAAAGDALLAAFPSRLADEVRTVLGCMPKAEVPPTSWFAVDVARETVAIPYRISADEVSHEAARALTDTQCLVLHCVYSRHHDGFVREHHAQQLLGAGEPWVLPFVVQLVGEYVLEILATIRSGLPDLAVPGSAHRILYGEFLARNPAFFARTQRRVVSYWSAYHRWRYPTFAAYPGGLLLESLRDAAADHTRRRWPRHAPPVPTSHGGTS